MRRDPAGRSAAHSEFSSLPRPACWTEDGNAVSILDQTALPARELRRTLETLAEVEEAILNLRVRGAPLIGVTAALAVAALATRALAEDPDLTPVALDQRVSDWCARLRATRPTAVNLSWALTRVEQALHTEFGREGSPGGRASAASTTARASVAETVRMVESVRLQAERIVAEDEETCRRIGEHGLQLLTREGRVLTHCNAGALATAGIGTALAPVYLARERGWPIKVFVGETRPLLQGSRLTAWELARNGVEVTLLTDHMAGALFAQKPPDLVLVGADRIARNGDVANKIGTYTLAVLAHHHGVPFYALAPTSTVDLTTSSGEGIPIEVRSPDEIRRGLGELTAPEAVPVWNPAFDVTPATLVSGIVTEHGVVRPPYDPALRQAVERGDREREKRWTS